MDTTFPSSWTNSSNCSRKELGMCALTCAVRFSRVMEKDAGMISGKSRPKGGGVAAKKTWKGD